MSPNTTPTPNELFNGEMKKMRDTELRVVMVVIRATLGWIVDKKTGMRKKEDWISYSQMIKKTGKSRRSLTYAIDTCVKNRWIETRTQEGKILQTANERKKYGRKVFYRLGTIFLNKIETSAKNARVKKKQPVQSFPKTSAKNDEKPVQNLHTTKESITKETLTKDDNLKKLTLDEKIRQEDRRIRAMVQ